MYYSDINECEESRQSICANGMCENTQGSYSCICDSGYELSPDGAFCLGKSSYTPLTWHAMPSSHLPTVGYKRIDHWFRLYFKSK